MRKDTVDTKKESLRYQSEHSATINPGKYKDVSDRIFFLYCYAKHLVSDYHNRVLQNNSEMSREYINDYIFKDFEARRDQLIGFKDLPDFGFKFMQNNQTMSILAGMNPPGGSNHFFSKVGTGQGKSLIIAMLALQYAKQGKRVHVFTVYRHLAKRDFGRFKGLFDRHGVSSQLITPKDFLTPLSAPNKDSLIVYSEMSDFFQSINYNLQRKSGKNLAESEAGVFNPFEQDIVILDEFDSIIFERDIFASTVYEKRGFLKLAKATRADLANEKSFETNLSKNKALRSMFVALCKHDLYDIYTNWYAKNHGTWTEGRDTFNDLGLNTHYIGGTFSELLSGNIHINPICLDVLAHLRLYKRVIGLSGSVDRMAIKRFNKLFDQANIKRPVSYIDVPPFYGLSQNNNREIRNFDCNSNTIVWLLKLDGDIRRAINDRQPVLIFADRNTSAEWNTVEALLRRIAGEKGHDVDGSPNPQLSGAGNHSR